MTSKKVVSTPYIGLFQKKGNDFHNPFLPLQTLLYVLAMGCVKIISLEEVRNWPKRSSSPNLTLGVKIQAAKRAYYPKKIY